MFYFILIYIFNLLLDTVSVDLCSPDHFKMNLDFNFVFFEDLQLIVCLDI